MSYRKGKNLRPILPSTTSYGPSFETVRSKGWSAFFELDWIARPEFERLAALFRHDFTRWASVVEGVPGEAHPLASIEEGLEISAHNVAADTLLYGDEAALFVPDDSDWWVLVADPARLRVLASSFAELPYEGAAAQHAAGADWVDSPLGEAFRHWEPLLVRAEPELTANGVSSTASGR